MGGLGGLDGLGNKYISLFTITYFKFKYAEARIYKEGLTERAIILCKLNKSLLESSTSVGKQVCIP